MKEKKCSNTLPLRVDSVLDSSGRDGGVLNATSDGLMKDHAKSGSLDDHVSSPAEASNSQGSLPVDHSASRSSLDDMMKTAYGDKLLYSDGGPRDSAWCQRWSVIVQHMGQHYSLPGGSIGKKYIDLLCEELQYLSLGTYHSERVIVFCAMMLQRDRLVRKGCDIRRLLERRMKLWRDEQFDTLLQEAVRCDQSLRNSRRRPSFKDSQEHLIKVFTRLMLEGNVRAAVRWLTERSGGGVLKPCDSTTIGGTSMTVLEALNLKHPDPCTPPDWVLPSMDKLPFLEDSEITGSHILTIAHQLQGGAGPGGCDASHWRDVLLRYGTSSTRLRDSVAGLCRHLCNSIVPWDSIRALVASRLIALDKCPGVRPIGIGETLRRIIGKAVCLATRLDAALVCGSDQLCAGLQAGIEGAIHGMNQLFSAHQDEGTGWGVLLVDAANAFNSLNRAAMLMHARVLWPRCARFLFNTYRGWSVLVLRGSSTYLYSKEGVTQGDPLSMFMYAIGTLPLIRSLNDPGHWTQLWYADDASASGALPKLRNWFNQLCSYGPSFGYYPEPTKSFVVVSERWKSDAAAVFGDLGVQVVTGHRFLGGFIGSPRERDEYVMSKVDRWMRHIDVLSEAASTQPQLAYAALSRSLQHEWTFLLRVVPQCGQLFQKLDLSLSSHFLPAMFGVEVSAVERRLFALPLRLGGLGICNPVALASHLFNSSVGGTVLPRMRITAHTRMGRPIRVWDNAVSHTRMGVPYEYTRMGRPIRVWAGIRISGTTYVLPHMRIPSHTRMGQSCVPYAYGRPI